jgi:hypothetical protein
MQVRELLPIQQRIVRHVQHRGIHHADGVLETVGIMVVVGINLARIEVEPNVAAAPLVLLRHFPFAVLQ